MNHGCSGCDNTWTGMAMAHCPTCHNTFSTVGNFDRHRKDGKCITPKKAGLVQNKRGTWRMPGERDLAEEWN